MGVWGNIPYVPFPSSFQCFQEFLCLWLHSSNLYPWGHFASSLSNPLYFSSKIIANRYSVYLQNLGGFQSQDPNYNKTLFPNKSTFSFLEFEYGHILGPPFNPQQYSFIMQMYLLPKSSVNQLRKRERLCTNFFSYSFPHIAKIPT